MGENQEPKPKTADPKPADIRTEPDPLPSLPDLTLQAASDHTFARAAETLTGRPTPALDIAPPLSQVDSREGPEPIKRDRTRQIHQDRT